MKYFLGDFLVSFPGKVGQASAPPQKWDHEPLTVPVAMGGEGLQGLDSCGHCLLLRLFWFRWGQQRRHLLCRELSKAKVQSVSIFFRDSLRSFLLCACKINLILGDSAQLWRDPLSFPVVCTGNGVLSSERKQTSPHHGLQKSSLWRILAAIGGVLAHREISRRIQGSHWQRWELPREG